MPPTLVRSCPACHRSFSLRCSTRIPLVWSYNSSTNKTFLVCGTIRARLGAETRGYVIGKSRKNHVVPHVGLCSHNKRSIPFLFPVCGGFTTRCVPYICFSMRSHAFDVLLALCAFAVSDGFIGQVAVPSSQQQQSASMLRMSASQPSGLDGTRRDMLKTAGAAVAGVLASTAVMPGAALAAAKPDPNRKGEKEQREPDAAGLFMLQNLVCRFCLVCEAPMDQRPESTASA